MQSPVTQRKLEKWRRLRPLRNEDETSHKRSPRPPPGRQRSRRAPDQGGRPGAGTSRPARAPARRPAGATGLPGPRAHSAAAGLLRAVLDALGFGGSPPPRAPWAAGTAESGAPGPGALRPNLGIRLLEPGAASLRARGVRTQVQRIGPPPGAAWPRVGREPPEARAAGPRPRSPVPSRTPLRPSKRTAGSRSGGLAAPEVGRAGRQGRGRGGERGDKGQHRQGAACHCCGPAVPLRLGSPPWAPACGRRPPVRSSRARPGRRGGSAWGFSSSPCAFFVCFLNAVTFRVGRSLHATRSLGIQCLCLGDSEGPGWTEGAGGRMGGWRPRGALRGQPTRTRARRLHGDRKTKRGLGTPAPNPGGDASSPRPPARPAGSWGRRWLGGRAAEARAGSWAGWGPGAGVGRWGRRGRGAPAPGSDAAERAARAVGAGREGAAAGFLRLPSGGGAEKPPQDLSAPRPPAAAGSVSAMSAARRRPPTLAPGPARGRVGARTLSGAGGGEPRPAHLAPTSPRPQHLGPPRLPRAHPSSRALGTSSAPPVCLPSL